MSLLYNLLFSGKAAGTHHKLALDATRHMRRHDADEWQNVFLAEVDQYFKGAKAPDDDFKDFRNHVLHVRENYWGGAAAKVQEWYGKTLESLKGRRWPEAVYNAGVLSHYFTDPIQPFHTGQSEREMIIHRAAEWSITKTYEELQTLLTKELGGYPNVKVSTGDDWLVALLREGAQLANANYDLLIDHYNFEGGVKTPQLGFDKEGKAAIAKLIGFAAVGFARVLDRAITEAGVLVPSVVIGFQTIYESMQAPSRAIAKKRLDATQRAIVEAMLDEYKRTGKVLETLPEDDKTVRRLYAEEVLKISLAELDKQKPGPIGAKYTGPVIAASKPAKTESKSAEPAKEANEQKTVAKAAPKRDDLNAPKLAPFPKAEATSQKPGGPTAEQTAGNTDRSSGLSLNSPLVDAPSIGPKTAERFAPLGIKTIGDFLKADPDTVSRPLKVNHITPELVADWQSQTRLMLDLPKLRARDVQLLVGVGIRSADELSQSNARPLFELVKDFCTTSAGERILREAKAPDLVEVSQWVIAAKKTRSAKAA